MASLFPYFYDEACLESLGGFEDNQTTLEVARLFFDDHASNLRVDTTAFGAWAFAALVCVTLAGQVPTLKTRSSSCLFVLWVGVQLAQVALYALAMVLEAMAFFSVRELTAPCAHRWNGTGVQSLDMLAALTLPFQGGLAQKFWAMQVSLVCLLSGLYVVDDSAADSSTLLGRAALWLRKGTYATKVALDIFGGALLFLGFLAWVCTLAMYFSVVFLPLPILALPTAILGVFALRAAGALLGYVCRRAKSVSSEAVGWIEIKRVEDYFEAAVSWFIIFYSGVCSRSRSRLDIGLFAQLAIAHIAVSPFFVASTWLAWRVYEGHGVDSHGAAMKDVYDAAVTVLADGLRPPPLADLLSLADLDSLEEFFASLDEIMDVNPAVLLTGSHIMCALSAILSSLRVVTMSIAKAVDVATQAGAVHVAPLATGAHALSHDGEIAFSPDGAHAFSPDGGSLAHGGDDDKVTLRKLAAFLPDPAAPRRGEAHAPGDAADGPSDVEAAPGEEEKPPPSDLIGKLEAELKGLEAMEDCPVLETLCAEKRQQIRNLQTTNKLEADLQALEAIEDSPTLEALRAEKRQQLRRLQEGLPTASSAGAPAGAPQSQGASRGGELPQLRAAVLREAGAPIETLVM